MTGPKKWLHLRSVIILTTPPSIIGRHLWWRHLWWRCYSTGISAAPKQQGKLHWGSSGIYLCTGALLSVIILFLLVTESTWSEKAKSAHVRVMGGGRVLPCSANPAHRGLFVPKCEYSHKRYLATVSIVSGSDRLIILLWRNDYILSYGMYTLINKAFWSL